MAIYLAGTDNASVPKRAEKKTSRIVATRYIRFTPLMHKFNVIVFQRNFN